jgi:hypothetical protein
MTTAVVGGALANKAGYGGEAWVRMSWVSGLRRLGIDAWLVENIDSSVCVDQWGAPCIPAESYNRGYFDEVTTAFGLARRAVLLVDGGREVFGAGSEALDAAREADLVVNIGGHLPTTDLFPRALWAYVDIDPGWTQFWFQTGNSAARIAGHDAFFSIAENLGTAGCRIPTAGIAWRPVRQPVVLDDWPVLPCPDPNRYTTVASWRNGLGPVGDDSLSGKHHEFRRLAALGRDGDAVHELALRIHPEDSADFDLLTENGWHVVDATTVVRTPEEFRTYVQGSGAECSAAQGVYAHTACGWFSDRSLRYLASGRPVLVQDTGLGGAFPVGDGLVTFDSLDTARAGRQRIAKDYSGHAAAARSLAETYFDSETVLGRFLDEVGIH